MAPLRARQPRSARAATPSSLPDARVPLTRQLRAHIKNYIVDNGLKAGDPLPSEAEWADAMGVSRVSLRESVKALEALGVLEAVHGRGLFVRKFNLDAALEMLSYSLDFGVSTIYELYQLRKWLEIAVIDEVCLKADADTVAKLDKVIEDWTRAVPSGDWPQYDRIFHKVLSEIVGNQMLLLIMGAFWTVFDNATDSTIKSQPDPYETITDHKRIVDAVRNRDRAAARAALEASYAAFEQRYRTAQATT
jgi:DNA-binding FadR family transcriptional regulator